MLRSLVGSEMCIRDSSTDPQGRFREFCRTAGLYLPVHFTALELNQQLTLAEFYTAISNKRRRVDRSEIFHSGILFRLIYLLYDVRAAMGHNCHDNTQEFDCARLHQALSEHSMVQYDLGLLGHEKFHKSCFAFDQLALGSQGVWFTEGVTTLKRFDEALKCEIEVVHAVSQLSETEEHAVKDQLRIAIANLQEPECEFALWPFDEDDEDVAMYLSLIHI
eukprot:TRINITY_DN27691_c0_g1_i7.p1 TRINITY_DN27691_c0_g1~~TRINITY_DN27691_c0_g1_i7.p1  ORF type:complete len:220 (-),score=66.64 TRINITY_DN27691_c0_g1_i7:183-842(-)